MDVALWTAPVDRGRDDSAQRSVVAGRRDHTAAAHAALPAGPGLRAARVRDRRSDAATGRRGCRVRAADRAARARSVAPAGNERACGPEQGLPRSVRRQARRQQHQLSARLRRFDRGQPQAHVLHAARRRRLRAAHRVCERRQPVRWTAGGTTERDCRPAVTRRHARARRHAVPGRERDLLGHRGCHRRGPRDPGAQGHRSRGRTAVAAQHRVLAQLARLGFHRGRGPGECRARRASARASGVEGRPGDDAEGRDARVVGRARRPSTRVPDRRRSRAVGGTARGLEPAAPHVPVAPAHATRLRSDGRGDRVRGRAGGQVRDAA